MLLMNLEMAPVQWEDLAKQVLTQGKRHDPEYFIQLINQVTKEDMNRIAVNMLRSKPAVASVGTLDQLPEFEEIESWLKSDWEGEKQNSRAGIFF